jgi:hypothetical protein
MNTEEKKIIFDTVAAVLLRCFLLSLVLIYFWFAFYWLSGNTGYAIHKRFFSCSRHDYDILNYAGIAFFKICAILFFLIPYLATKWALQKKQRDEGTGVK